MSLVKQPIATEKPRIRHKIRFIDLRHFADAPTNRATRSGETMKNTPVTTAIVKNTESIIFSPIEAVPFSWSFSPD
jgi:hypothetical protein